MHVGFTGTRLGMTKAQANVVLQALRVISEQHPETNYFHHGDCIGADDEVHDLAMDSGYYVIIHPPDKMGLRALRSGMELRAEKPFLARNRDIVDESDTLIAAPDSKKERRDSGTWHTVRYARNRSRKVLLVFPDGQWRKEGGE